MNYFHLNLQKKVEVLRQPLGRRGDPDAVRRPPSRDPPPTAALPEVEIAWDHSFDSSFDSLTAPSLRSETTAEKSGTSPPSTVERWSCRTALAESDRRRRMHLREAETACDERERVWTAWAPKAPWYARTHQTPNLATSHSEPLLRCRGCSRYASSPSPTTQALV